MTAPTPPLVAFTDGTVPDAPGLNALPTNVTHLYDYLHGGWRIRRPIISLRTTRESREIPTNTDLLLGWDLADINTDHMWTGVVSEAIAVHTPGIYRVGLQVALVASAASSAAVLAARICRNGTNVAQDSVCVHYAPVQAGAGAAAACSTTLALAAGDRLWCFATQNSGGTVGIDPGFGATRAWAIWLGPQ